MRELGIMGGYFNPIHNWHLILGDWAAYRFGLDRVLYIPSGIPPHPKKNLLDGEKRFEMVSAAVASHPRFEASRIEIDRPGVTWSIDTLIQLKQQYGDGVRLNFIIGEDNIKALKDYDRRDEFLSLCRLLVACRGNADEERVKQWKLDLPGADIGVIDCPASEMSSTLVRELIEKGLPYRYFVPASVFSIIERDGLYRLGTGSSSQSTSTATPDNHRRIETMQSRKRTRRTPVRNYGMPSGFVWGASTSAYQIEGGHNADGKGPGMWDHFSKIPGRMHNGDTGDVACDHYHRWRSDVGLMKKLGLDAYRFSISWSRVLPEGKGKVNERGLDFYDRLVDALLRAEIDPYVTLYHWDLPQGLLDPGQGWLNRDVGLYFADYANLMVKRLGDRVKRWATFNEPEVIVAGYLGTGLAPGYDNPALGYQAGHSLMVAHGRAMQAMRAAHPGNEYGIVLNFVPIYPWDKSDEAKKAARRRWELSYGWYLDGLVKAHYPESVFEESARLGGPLALQPGDMALMSQKLDFLGVNFYTRFFVDGTGATRDLPDVERTQMGWEIYPRSLSDMLMSMNREYALPPIYITENGAALDDTLAKGRVADAHRIRYLDGHLRSLAHAVKNGVDVRGYFVWSLMDNLEWSLGFSKTFGLIHVNRKTLHRTIKDSGRWYSEVIKANSQKSA